MDNWLVYYLDNYTIPLSFTNLYNNNDDDECDRGWDSLEKKLSFDYNVDDVIECNDYKFGYLDHLSKCKNDAHVYVFKSCSKDWIVIMIKYKDVMTNELRSYVSSPKFAEHRTSKLKVVDIVHKFDSTKDIKYITDNNIEYEVGKNVFDFKNGISYYLSYQPAFYRGIDKVANGVYKSWHTNGELKKRELYKNNVKLYDIDKKIANIK